MRRLYGAARRRDGARLPRICGAMRRQQGRPHRGRVGDSPARKRGGKDADAAATAAGLLRFANLMIYALPTQVR